MIPAKTLDRAISNIKYRLGKYYVRMGLTPFPQKEYVEIFPTPPLPRDPYVINEWPLRATGVIILGTWRDEGDSNGLSYCEFVKCCIPQKCAT